MYSHRRTATPSPQIACCICCSGYWRGQDCQRYDSTISVIPLRPWPCKTAWTSRPSAVCWVTTRRVSRWTPTPTLPLTPSSKRRKRWAISYPVLSDGFRYLLPLGSAFGSEKSSGRKQQLMQTKRPEALRFRVFLARREGFEPPAFWSVGCLQEKTEPFWLRFALFAAVYWMAFPLFPFSSAHSNSNLGQKWVKDRCMAGEFEQSVRIHTDRLIGQQLFLPKGLRLDHFIGRHGLWQELQN